MDRQHVTEGTPLFSSPTRRDRHDDSTRERSTRESSTLEIGATLVSTPMSQIQEAIICKVHHPDTSEPSTDARCKDQGVQSELSTLQGWELTFGLLPGLLTAVPYGIAADRYGRRVILSLSLLGFALVQATDAVICWFPGIFPLRSVWLAAMWTLVGGGPFVFSAVVFAIASDVSTEAQRSATFFHLAAAIIGGQLVAGPLAFLAMARGPWFSVLLGVGCLSTAVLVALGFPETRQKASENDDDDYPPSLDPGPGLSPAALRRAAMSIRRLFWDNKRLGLLLFSLVFTTLGRYISVILAQYTTKRFHWSWSEAALLSSISASVNLLLVAVVLPLVSRLLLSRLGLSPLVKDLCLVKAGLSALIIGALGIGLAPNSSLLIASIMVYALGYGYSPAMRSLLTLVAGHDNIGTLFTAMSVLETAGTLLAGPLMAATFRLGLAWGEFWIGLPFVSVGAIMTCAAVIVFGIRLQHVGEGTCKLDTASDSRDLHV
ncbi:hypothetical protein G6O67_001122 [Ophiocordyceps sinensis]|uniref:Major facilitator superfamily domain, general substrate transporter n=1 Tax=Ophiocordyceps sinensis TaxID=72228 RepID=A0A8H4V8W5_9HYPO|nr:hypothetical protein G6O67_001122 [Ophiocordyceps sinensis]